MRAGGSYRVRINIEIGEVVSDVSKFLEVNIQFLQPVFHVTVLQGAGDKDASYGNKIWRIAQTGIRPVRVVENRPCRC